MWKEVPKNVVPGNKGHGRDKVQMQSIIGLILTLEQNFSTDLFNSSRSPSDWAITSVRVWYQKQRSAWIGPAVKNAVPSH